MATVGTITMYASDNSGSSYSKDSNNIAYVGRLNESKYRVYYQVPITYDSNEQLTSLTLQTSWRVSKQGQPGKNTLYARLYADKTSAQKYDSSYIEELSYSHNRITATGIDVSFTFTLKEENSTSTTYYVCFYVKDPVDTEVLEIDGNESTNNGHVHVTVETTGGTQHTAIFLGRGGNPAIATISKYYNEPLGTLPTVTRIGYTFLGWYTSPGGGEQITAETKMPSGGAYYYARWKTHILTVNYHAEGGRQLEGTGTEYVWSDTSQPYVTKGNYDSYNIDQGYYNAVSATFYLRKEGYYLSSDATWKIYNVVDGTYLIVDEYTGYTPAQMAEQAGQDLTVGDATVDAYANWQRVYYNIVYNGNKATSGTMANTRCEYDETKTLTKNAFIRSYTINYNNNYDSNTTSTKVNATFNGWNTQSDGSGTSYSDQQSIKNLRTTVGTYNLYAMWSLNSTTLPTLSRKGYTFDGWYTAASGGTKIGNGGASYTPTANTTLYAHWTIQQFTATFDANGGSTPIPQTITKNYNSELGTLPTTSKTGYALDGWYTAASGGTKISSTTKLTANITYYAHWKPSGIVHIWENDKWNSFICQIWDGTSWIQVLPYIYDDTTKQWQLYSGK